jgi:hypothetical protein
MEQLTAVEVRDAVIKAVREVMGSIASVPFELEMYKHKGGYYESYVCQLASIPGLMIVQQGRTKASRHILEKASSIKARGYILEQYSDSTGITIDEPKLAEILICDKKGGVLVTVSRGSEQAMIEGLKPLLVKEGSSTSALPPRTWLHRLDEVLDAALEDDVDDVMVSVSRREFIDLARKLLTLVQPRVRGAGVGQ